MLKMSDEKKKPSVTIGVKFVDAPIKKSSVGHGYGKNRRVYSWGMA